ncbi:hypothetical protein EOPP23_10895 [Endozoicomonas sp. OPT23]|nr:hypothetical protein [Endozoicomonas sp. OPT23]
MAKSQPAESVVGAKKNKVSTLLSEQVNRVRGERTLKQCHQMLTDYQQHLQKKPAGEIRVRVEGSNEWIRLLPPDEKLLAQQGLNVSELMADLRQQIEAHQSGALLKKSDQEFQKELNQLKQLWMVQQQSDKNDNTIDPEDAWRNLLNQPVETRIGKAGDTIQFVTLSGEAPLL